MWCSSDEHFFRIVQVPAKGDGRWPIHRKPGAADVAPRPDPHLRPKDVYSSGVWWKILLHDVWCWPWQKRVSLSFGFAGGLDPAWCTRVLADPLWRIRIHWICIWKQELWSSVFGCNMLSPWSIPRRIAKCPNVFHRLPGSLLHWPPSTQMP